MKAFRDLRNVNRGLSKIIEYSMFSRCKEHLTIYLGPIGRSRSMVPGPVVVPYYIERSK